jgi:hypothetical protein
MPMPAVVASLRTVSTTHASASLDGCEMTCAPVDHFAICFDMRSEMIAPVKPTTAENTSSPPRFIPVCAAIARSSPSRRSTIDRTSTTARFVTMRSRMRFMERSGCQNAGAPS